MEEAGKTLDGDSVTRSGCTSPRSLEVIRYQMFKFIVNALNDILSVVELYLVVSEPQATKAFPGADRRRRNCYSTFNPLFNQAAAEIVQLDVQQAMRTSSTISTRLRGR